MTLEEYRDNVLPYIGHKCLAHTRPVNSFLKWNKIKYIFVELWYEKNYTCIMI